MLLREFLDKETIQKMYEVSMKNKKKKRKKKPDKKTAPKS